MPTFVPFSATIAVPANATKTGGTPHFQTRPVYLTAICCNTQVEGNPSSFSSSSLHCHDLGYAFVAKPAHGFLNGRRVYTAANCTKAHSGYALAIRNGAKQGRPVFAMACCIPPPKLPFFISVGFTQVPGKKFVLFGSVGEVDYTGNYALWAVVYTGHAVGITGVDALANFSTGLGVDVPSLGDVEFQVADGTYSNELPNPTVTLTNSAPYFSSFIITPLGGSNYQLHGIVEDDADHGAGLTVSLSGASGINGHTATVAADGSWSAAVSVAGPPFGPSPGDPITATVVDWYGDIGTDTIPWP